MNILFISKRHYTNRDLILDRFGRLFHLPAYLARQGHPVTYVAANYRARADEEFRIAGVTFLSLGFRPYQLFRYLLKLWSISKKNRPDMIIASSDIHFGLLGLCLARWFGVPLVFDVYDQYAAFSSCRIPGMKHIYHLMLKKADLVLVASRPMERFVADYNANVLLTPNGIDPEVFKKQDKQAVRSRLGIDQESLVVGYFGSMEKQRGIDTLIAACAELRREFPNLILLMAGKSEDDLDLQQPWIKYRGQVSQTEVADLISAADVCALPYIPSTLVNMGSSCKTAEYLACGIPIVISQAALRNAEYFLSDTGLADTVKQGLYDQGSITGLGDAIRRQLTNPKAFPADLAVTWETIGDNLLGRLKEF